MMVTIHDPIHGTIELSAAETKLVDSRPFQRLRFIKQLGFSEYAFPGATHSRYGHSLGAMQMGTKIIDRLLDKLGLASPDAILIRQSVRLAVLFHDLGHAPMSHVSERVMPAVGELKLGAWVTDETRQATHEDYTVKLLIDSELTALIETHFGSIGVTGSRLAHLVCGYAAPQESDAFVVIRDGKHVDLAAILHQIVSGEVDADRMDYLRRDAYYCGVSYGNYDHLWLINNLTVVEHEGRLALALSHKGVWAFENFLLARYHMFLSIYYHHTAICFDHLLGRFYDSGEYSLPGDSESYIETDDIELMGVLRRSSHPGARAVVARQPYRLLVEKHDAGDASEIEALESKLKEAKIDYFAVRKKAVLSKYISKESQDFPLLVVERELGRVSRIEDYTPLYRRFEDEVGVARVFCAPGNADRARALLT
jgi:uncharacterized protein